MPMRPPLTRINAMKSNKMSEFIPKSTLTKAIVLTPHHGRIANNAIALVDRRQNPRVTFRNEATGGPLVNVRTFKSNPKTKLAQSLEATRDLQNNIPLIYSYYKHNAMFSNPRINRRTRDLKWPNYHNIKTELSRRGYRFNVNTGSVY